MARPAGKHHNAIRSCAASQRGGAGSRVGRCSRCCSRCRHRPSYATANNFTGTQLYPPGARCLVHESMAEGLAAAAAVLRPHGQVLVFWDCYRPHDVQVRMFDVVPNPAWVARPGKYAHSHEAGRSVDVTFASAQRQCPSVRRSGELCLADMGTDFDDFSSRATAFATQGVSAEAQANRAHLRAAMQAGG